MEKIIIIILLILLIFINGFIFVIAKKTFNSDKNSTQVTQTIKEDTDNKNGSVNKIIMDIYEGEYQVYQNDHLIKTFNDFDDAITYAKNYENSAVKRLGGSWLWDSTPIFNVYKTQSEEFKAFSNFADAVNYANSIGTADIFYRNNKSFIWNNYQALKPSNIINNVPRVTQYPELYRGCEVTALTMLLNYKGVNVDKMTLAQNIIKDNTPYSIQNGRIFYGNPNTGFVGDIYDKNKNGLGVYHGPIYELLTTFIGGQALDISGCRREDVLFYLNKNIPVWVIVNTKYQALPSDNFQTWNTNEGNVVITYSEHSVLVTGYDNEFIYFNDPMDSSAMKKTNRENFFKAWEQMGKQAVTYCP